MPKKILLADDSITIQKVVELTFSDGDYEVIATNNGTKAIETLSRIRPDIILSDIIMPEKNGYEVCEYVKSHADLKNIPVILLTGTFEPFDPDRAEKAGCDAVVTKPFESQGLIQKVEQLIQQAAAAEAPAAPTIEEPAPRPSAPPAPAPEESPFDATAEPPPGSPFEDSAPPVEPEEDVFGEPEQSEDFGETKLIPKMTFEDLQRMRDASQAPISYGETESPEPAPATPALELEAPAPAEEEAETGGETKLIPKMTFEDLQRMQVPAEPAKPEPEPIPAEETPFSTEAPSEPVAAEESPFESAPQADDAFAPMEEEASPFGADSALPSEEPEPEVSMPESEAQLADEQETPFEDDMEPPVEAASETEAEAPFAAEPELEPETEPMAAPSGGPLSDDDVDRIARRVVELMSEKVVREVAWEVTPEMAEMAVRERIRQLEAEEEI